jgi:hypothetical protein
VRAARFNLFLLGLIALLLALAAAINGVVDPLQVLRRATWYAPHFSTNQRYQAPGLARYYVQPIVVAATSRSRVRVCASRSWRFPWR